MTILYILILIVLVVLKLCAKIFKPDVPRVENGYSKVFLPEAAQLYTWYMRISQRVAKRRVGLEKSRLKGIRVLHGLQTLNPGESADSLNYRYRVELISSMLLVVGAGACMCLAISLMASGQSVLKDGDVIYRSDYGGMDVEADLSAGIVAQDESNEYPLTVNVPARVYSKEEADALFDEMSDRVDTILLNDNDSPDHILYPLSLVRSVEGYPFSISWECSDYELLDYDGVVHNEGLTEPVIVTLTGDCVYMKEHWYLIRSLLVCPRELTTEELIAEEIADAVEDANLSSSSETALKLPSSISYGDITWREYVDDVSPMVMLGVLLVACMLIPFRETEISSGLKKRSRELLIAYPAFVSQLTLYMGAGMSVRNCLLRLGRKAAGRPDDLRTYLEKELIITAHELEMGISEIEAVTRFGKRCGTREYMRFSTLLVQNMRKGSTDLISVLKEEASDAFILRKNEARKLGEEASTKLLLPMVMMLTVVMIIIMVPAYMSFST